LPRGILGLRPMIRFERAVYRTLVFSMRRLKVLNSSGVNASRLLSLQIVRDENHD